MANLLLSILSGYAGRHFLGYLNLGLKGRTDKLAMLRVAYTELNQQSAAMPAVERGTPPASLFIWQWLADKTGRGRSAESPAPDPRALRLAGTIADLEYATAADSALKARLRMWLAIHIGTSIAFYVLLCLHVAASLQYGLRWFS